MPKIFVTYYSKTGNTKRIAEAIYEVLPGPKTISPIIEAKEIEAYDLIFVGFPVHAHSVPYSAERFLAGIPRRMKVALFCTHGSLGGSPLAREAIEHAVVVASQARIVSTFSCRGRISPEALEAISKFPEHEAWAGMAVSAQTHPDDKDLEDARAFARWALTLSRQEN
jgi:flavodoxin